MRRIVNMLSVNTSPYIPVVDVLKSYSANFQSLEVNSVVTSRDSVLLR